MLRTEKEGMQKTEKEGVLRTEKEGVLRTEKEGGLRTEKEVVLRTEKEGVLRTEKEGVTCPCKCFLGCCFLDDQNSHFGKHCEIRLAMGHSASPHIPMDRVSWAHSLL